jgi:hypothetical protein
MEKALTLKMAADLLKVSYATVYARREELGFFQIGSVWRVWPDTLRSRLAAKQEEKARPREKTTPPISKGVDTSFIYSADQLKAQKEFAELAAKKFVRPNPKRDTK